MVRRRTLAKSFLLYLSAWVAYGPFHRYQDVDTQIKLSGGTMDFSSKHSVIRALFVIILFIFSTDTAVSQGHPPSGIHYPDGIEISITLIGAYANAPDKNSAEMIEKDLHYYSNKFILMPPESREFSSVGARAFIECYKSLNEDVISAMLLFSDSGSMSWKPSKRRIQLEDLLSSTYGCADLIRELSSIDEQVRDAVSGLAGADIDPAIRQQAADQVITQIRTMSAASLAKQEFAYRILFPNQ
jgi:hypothetical protein